MAERGKPTFSIVIPVYNEAGGLRHFHQSLKDVMSKAGLLNKCEIIYCEDGSIDSSKKVLDDIAKEDDSVKTIIFSRNFGKESALTAGIAQACGQAIITLDSDEQHPVELIPAFIDKWNKGAKVVIGIRKSTNANWLKRTESKMFYSIFNRLSKQKLIPGSTDFRLIDKSVQEAFLSLGESNRITRGLIDWLGFERSFISFEPKKRNMGSPNYNHSKLVQLAMNSLVSLSPRPLYILGYIGLIITGISFVLGAIIIIEQIVLGDPLHLRFTGTAMLGILILFFIGIVLTSQGVIAIYISHIHTETKRRPLYVIDKASSKGIAGK
ncbi:glycosyltransferase family 2 protein [Candidatus Saccharibacteria bacterium]|nr:glycosyltransferase family 2 protein [Candidatus Saccharibacteria bacterium]